MFDDEVNITLEGRRHLAAVIGSKEFKNQYCQEKVDKWLREMESLTEFIKRVSHTLPMSLSLRDLNPNSLITCAPSNRLKSMWTPSKK